MKSQYIFNIDNVDSNSLTKIQDRAIRATHSARESVQVALVATVAHLYRYHDVRVARRLVDGLQDTVRGKAVIDFLCRFGHMTVGKVEIDGKEVNTFAATVGDAQEHAAAVKASYDEAKATQWWKLAPNDVNKFKGWSLDQALLDLVAKNKKQLDKAAKHPELAEKINVQVSDKTIQAVVAMCNFDAILEDVAKAA